MKYLILIVAMIMAFCFGAAHGKHKGFAKGYEKGFAEGHERGLITWIDYFKRRYNKYQAEDETPMDKRIKEAIEGKKENE